MKNCLILQYFFAKFLYLVDIVIFHTRSKDCTFVQSTLYFNYKPTNIFLTRKILGKKIHSILFYSLCNFFLLPMKFAHNHLSVFQAQSSIEMGFVFIVGTFRNCFLFCFKIYLSQRNSHGFELLLWKITIFKISLGTQFSL